MSRDKELRTLVEEQPGDAEAISVYADWLEGEGDMPRATFLRSQQQLRAMKVSSPKLLEKGRVLHDLGKKLPAEWVAAVTHPKLAGTAWEGRDDDGELVWRFLANGFINYTQPSGTFENGRWEQIGNTVAMDTNAHYADYFGVIVGDVIRGNAYNIVHRTWRWKVKLTVDETVVAVPDETNRTIHDDHVRARNAPKKRTKKRAGKPKRPLARKAPLKRTAKLRSKAKPKPKPATRRKR